MGKLQCRWTMIAAGMLLSASVWAQVGPVELNITPQPLGQALNALARQSGAQIMFVTDVTAGKMAPAVKGRLTVRQALERLLAGSDLQIQAADERTFTVARPAAATAANAAAAATTRGDQALPEVQVVAAPDPADLPRAYAGGQVARGARLGMLGNRDIMDTPFNITSYTAQAIENQQARSLADALANDASTRAMGPAGGLAEDFFVRGFASNSADIALNGMFGLLPFYRVPTEVVERVEILKGPSALLNGMAPSGAVGGSINVVAKRADDVPLTRVTGSYISDGQFGAHVDVGRRFGEDNQIGIRVNGAYRSGDTNVDHTSEKLKLGALGLDYRGQRVRLSLDVISQEEDIEGTRRMPQFAPGVAIPAAPSSSVNWFPNAYSRQKDDTVLAHGEVDFNDIVSGFASVGHRRSRSELLLGNPAGVTATGTFASSLAYWNAYTDTDSAEAGLRFNFATGPVKHNLVVSGNVLKQEDGRILSAFSAPVPSSIYNPVAPNLPSIYPGATPKISSSLLTGVALADTMAFADDKLLVTLGVRRQAVSGRNFNPAGVVTSRYDAHAMTPMVGLVVKPWERVSLYANYIQGLSPGSQVNDLSAPNFGQTFAPYKTEQYETGVKYDMGRLSTTLAIFQISKPSLIKDPVTSIYNADGEQRNRGLEWNVFGEVAPHVRVLGGVAYTAGKLTKTAGGVSQGNTPISVPKWQANIGGEWDTPWLPNLTLSARGIYTDRQFVDVANKQSIPSWVRYDIGARYQTVIAGKKVEFRANVENLFNRDYWVSPGTSYVALSAPRTFVASASVDF